MQQSNEGSEGGVVGELWDRCLRRVYGNFHGRRCHCGSRWFWGDLALGQMASTRGSTGALWVTRKMKGVKCEVEGLFVPRRKCGVNQRQMRPRVKAMSVNREAGGESKK